MATETLQADWALALAKDTAKYMMSPGEEDSSAAKSDPTESDTTESGETLGEKSGIEADDDARARVVTESAEGESSGAHIAVTSAASTGADDDESNVDAEVEVAVDVDDEDISEAGDVYDSMRGFED